MTSWISRIRASRLKSFSRDSFSHIATFLPCASGAHRPWSILTKTYIRNLSGVVGGFHLLGLSQQRSFLVIQLTSFLLMVLLRNLELNDVLLLFSNLFLQFAYLIDYFIQLFLGFQQLSTNLARTYLRIK